MVIYACLSDFVFAVDSLITQVKPTMEEHVDMIPTALPHAVSCNSSMARAQRDNLLGEKLISMGSSQDAFPPTFPTSLSPTTGGASVSCPVSSGNPAETASFQNSDSSKSAKVHQASKCLLQVFVLNMDKIFESVVLMISLDLKVL